MPGPAQYGPVHPVTGSTPGYGGPVAPSAASPQSQFRFCRISQSQPPVAPSYSPRVSPSISQFQPHSTSQFQPHSTSQYLPDPASTQFPVPASPLLPVTHFRQIPVTASTLFPSPSYRFPVSPSYSLTAPPSTSHIKSPHSSQFPSPRTFQFSQLQLPGIIPTAPPSYHNWDLPVLPVSALQCLPVRAQQHPPALQCCISPVPPVLPVPAPCQRPAASPGALCCTSQLPQCSQ